MKVNNYKGDVVLGSIPPRVSDYTVYQDEIWRVSGSRRGHIEEGYKLEQRKTGKSVWVNLKDFNKLFVIHQPAGYIEV